MNSQNAIVRSTILTGEAYLHGEQILGFRVPKNKDIWAGLPESFTINNTGECKIHDAQDVNNRRYVLSEATGDDEVLYVLLSRRDYRDNASAQNNYWDFITVEGDFSKLIATSSTVEPAGGWQLQHLRYFYLETLRSVAALLKPHAKSTVVARDLVKAAESQLYTGKAKIGHLSITAPDELPAYFSDEALSDLIGNCTVMNLYHHVAGRHPYAR